MAKGGNFKIRSVNIGGVGVIIVERVNLDYVKKKASHFTVMEFPRDDGKVRFNASDGPFLTNEGYTIIVKA